MVAVAYSVGAHLQGGGLAEVALHAARGLSARGYLSQFLVLGGTAPGLEPWIRTFPTWLVSNRVASRLLPDPLRDVLFDRWVAAHLGRCDVFYGWAHHSLRSVAKAQQRGAITFIDRGSIEAESQRRLLEEEHRLHGFPVGPMRARDVGRAREEYLHTDVIAVPSRFVHDSFLSAGYPAGKLFLNPLGVDPDRFVPADRTEDRFRVVFLGRVGLQKGVIYLLRAWAKLRLSNAELLLVGPVEPEARPLLLQEIRGAGDTAHLLGPSNQPEKVLQRASALVLPSVQDGFGLVVLEAMACGLPVVVSDHVGAKDCVREGMDGFVVPIRDVDALAERIQCLHADESRRRAMGQNARARALDFTWDPYRERLLAKIEAVAGGRGRGAVPRCEAMIG